MNVRVGKKRVKLLSWLLVLLSMPMKARLSTLANNDPFPVFSTQVPNDFLYRYHTSYLKGMADDDEDHRLSFVVTPFLQRAKQGTNRNKKRSELGDIRGPWGLVALLYGDIPCSQERGDVLNKAFRCAQFCEGANFCGDTPTPGLIDDHLFTSTRFMHDPQFADLNRKFGFFSVPLTYRKAGVRFEATGLLTHDIGINLVFGVSDITQSSTGMVDLTPSATGGPNHIFESSTSRNELKTYITQRVSEIFKKIGLDVFEFHESSVEDLQMAAFWRHAFTINKGQQKSTRAPNSGYQEFLFVPFLTVDGSLGLGKAKNPARAFALPFGNNSHHAIGFSAGFGLDFFETVEIGVSAGGAHFFNREFHNISVPTYELQSGIFPFKTDICVQPGNNWHFTAMMDAYHFLDAVSFHVQYVLVNHSRDKITLLRPNNGTRIKLIECPPPVTPPDVLSPCSCSFSGDSGMPAPDKVDNVFNVDRLEQESSWTSQLLDVALNVDIASQASLGLLWQIPVKQRNAYRSTTVAVSFEARF